jgi:FdhD protein
LSIKKRKIFQVKLDSSNFLEKEDIIAVDSFLCVFINNEFYRAFVVTPEKLREFVIGHLISEGVIDLSQNIKEIEIVLSKIYVKLDHNIKVSLLSRRNANIVTTSCGLANNPQSAIPLKTLWNDSSLFVTPEKIWYVAQKLQRKSKIYLTTGGTHSAVLYSLRSKVLILATDVGRHNAVDKVIGEGVSKNMDLRNCILISSGRLSGEIVLKAARSGIPIIGSVSGPLESGIKIAEETGLTLIGFIRGKRMNLYSHHTRIKFEEIK